MTITATDGARQAYDRLADAYDTLTRNYDYERWLGVVGSLAAQHGSGGRRLLDVACGTGKSFLPLAAAGYDVAACDISPRMLGIAAAKASVEAALYVADMRDLPIFGVFDLVTCLGDSLNYLRSRDELVAAMRGIRGNLAPTGIAVFDLNTLATYRSAFTSAWVLAESDQFLVWQGHETADFAPGAEAEASIEIFLQSRHGMWRRSTSRHRQRHWPVETAAGIAASAGMTVLACHGQHRGATLDPFVDEAVHAKALFVCAAS